MKKLCLLVGCLLLSSTVGAANILCNPDECEAMSRAMYEGFAEGYAKRMVEYKIAMGKQSDKKTERAEVLKLMPYEVFDEYFQECGNDNAFPGDAQACMLDKIVAYIAPDHSK